MTEHQVFHDTIQINKAFEASPDRVFAAMSDPRAREQWAPPSENDVVTYLESDFRVGGRDVSMCGPKDNPVFRVEAHYRDIVENRRLLFTETISHDERKLSVSLITVIFLPEGEGTRLQLTVQIAACDSPDMIEGCKAGMSTALDNLVGLCDRSEV